jgi:predicted  nucleic acid-binding Zn-ribbon protein
MGKRSLHNDDDMEIKTIHEDLTTLKRQMGEVILILGGSASYDYKGMRADVRELKTDVSNIKVEIEKMKRDDIDKEKESSFVRIKLKTIPQKIAAILAFLAVALTVIQNLREMFTK